MQRRIYNFWLAAGAVSVAIAQPANAQNIQRSEPAESAPIETDDTDTGFFGEAEIGVRYDSDVAIDELDLTSRQSDEALRAKLRIGYETEVSDDTEFRLAYGLSQTWHEDFSSFDLQTHTLATSISHDLGPARVGLSYRFVHARLDRDGFLDIHRVTPTISGFVAEGLYARAELLYRKSDFLGRVDRDSKTFGGGLDLYLFLDGARQYVSAGYDFTDVDAVDPQFDYVGHTVKLGFTQKFEVGGNDGQMKLGWRYQSRDYQGITPSIGRERDDDRHRLRAEVAIPLADWASISARYTYSDYASNLSSVDYSQNVMDMSLVFEF